MKAALLVQPEKIEIDEVDMPAVAPSEVLVKLKSCGVCATDVKKFTGGSKAPHMPFILGHEPAGEIIEVDKGVGEEFLPGARVAIAPVYTCGHCHGCRTGLTFSQGMGMCENYEVLGYSIDGAFTEYLSVPAQHVYPIPDELSYRDAALIEPIAACVNGVLRANLQPPGIVVVLGAGFMGLVSIQLFALLGNKVVATDLLPERRELALEFGADLALDPESDKVTQEVMKLTGDRGADAVLCSVGGKAITEEGMDMLKKGGTLVLLASAPGGTQFEVDLNKLHYDQSIITGSVSYTGPGYQWSMDVLSRGQINADALITNVGPLEDVERFMDMTAKLEGLKKVVLF